MNLKNCLIIDDDPLICDLLKHFCSKQEWLGHILSVGDGAQALQALNAEKFDLIFLDYNLPDFKGKKLLELMPLKTPTIMVTTEEAFGAESYEFEQIIDFLVKPITYERFLKAIQRFLQSKKSNAIYESETFPQNIFVKDGNTTVIIRLNEIRYIKSESNYLIYYLGNKKVMTLQSLKKMEAELPENFVRVQKSYMINLDFLEAINSYSTIVSGIEIPIGTVHREHLLTQLKKWNDR